MQKSLLSRALRCSRSTNSGIPALAYSPVGQHEDRFLHQIPGGPVWAWGVGGACLEGSGRQVVV
eukprot:1192082-Pyramimonas_sp.AAC.1